MSEERHLPPPCEACNGYGFADGEPGGTWNRDFGPDDPGPCPACSGTGNATEADEEAAAAVVFAAGFGGASPFGGAA